MSKSLLKLLIVLLLINPMIAVAISKTLSFPIDHGKHREADWESWDFFGHLIDANNRVFGFSLTFLRLGVTSQQPPSLWRTEDIYASYFTITDGEQKQFYSQEKANRTSFNFAGASDTQLWIWNRGWQVFMNASDIVLQAKTKDAALNLRLRPAKSPLLFAQNGFFDRLGLYYYSLPNLEGNGELRLNENKYQIVAVRGGMDHAFQMNKNNDVVWDKFNIQLNNGDDILLYIFASKKSLFISPNSFCIISHADGSSTLLSLADFQFTRLNSWRSEKSKTTYPSGWTLTIPNHHYYLKIIPIITNQEITTLNTTYWNGQSLVTGEKDGAPLMGYAYIELSKYLIRSYTL